MNFVAKITRVSDGAVATYAEDWMKDWKDGDDFNWSEGNFSCDCNRALFFARARGEEEPDIDCSDGMYRVRIEDENGAVLYEDDPKQEATKETKWAT